MEPQSAVNPAQAAAAVFVEDGRISPPASAVTKVSLKGKSNKESKLTQQRMPGISPLQMDKKNKSIITQMGKRMEDIARKGLDFENKTRKNAVNAIEDEDVNYRLQKGWKLSRDISERNIMNLTAIGSKKQFQRPRQLTTFHNYKNSINENPQFHTDQKVFSDRKLHTNRQGGLQQPMYQGSAQFINTFTNDIINHDHDQDPVNITNDRYFSNKNQHKVLPELNLGNINDSTIYSPKQNKQVSKMIHRHMSKEYNGQTSQTSIRSPNSMLRTCSNSTFNLTSGMPTGFMPQIITTPRNNVANFGFIHSPTNDTKTNSRQIAHTIMEGHDKFDAYNKKAKWSGNNNHNHNTDSYNTVDAAVQNQTSNTKFQSLTSPRTNSIQQAQNFNSTVKTTTFARKQSNQVYSTAKVLPQVSNRKAVSRLNGSPSKQQNLGQNATKSLDVRSRMNAKLYEQITLQDQQTVDYRETQLISSLSQLHNSTCFNKDNQKINKYQQQTNSSMNNNSFTNMMTDSNGLRQAFKLRSTRQKDQIMRDFSKNNSQMEGILSVYETNYKHQKERASNIDQVNQYAKNFSEIADLVNLKASGNAKPAMQIFADAVKNLAQKNLVKIKLRKGLMRKMEHEQSKRIEDQAGQVSKLPKKDLQDQLENLFQRASNDDHETIQGKANEFIQRMKYYEKFKKRDMDQDGKNDPAIKYFKKCQEEKSLLLPIFEKIYKKTLCLQNYIISEGQCQGIAEACKYIDHKQMNRVLFNNCGLTGNKFANILEGLALIRDFKSIIYKHNELNALSIEKFQPIFDKNIPHQLSDLQIVDCRIHCTQIEQLLDLMIEKAEIKSFTLVNVHHSEDSFNKLCYYVANSYRLRDLNVSWQCLRPSKFVQLLEVIHWNRTLISLNISWNKIMEDQPKALTMKQIEEGLTEVPLSRRNTQIIDHLASFIKYNTYLVHLDLSNCGLEKPAMEYLVTFLNKAQALQCLHLSNNGGVTPSMIEWIAKRIHGEIKEPDVVIPPMSKEFQYDKNKVQPLDHGLIKILRHQQSVVNQPEEATEKLWKDIRQGLKLKNIVQSKRINEQDQIQCSGGTQKLIIQRHLGFKEMMPDSGRWKICADENSECWYCGQHILTLFIWTPRISQLSALKERNVINYYKDAIDLIPTEIKSYNVPHIIGPFSNWNYQEMREIIPFCRQYDKNAPDFLKIAVQKGLVRQVCAEDSENMPLTQVEKQYLEDEKGEYYNENWSRIILKFMRFSVPNIANAQYMQKLSLQQDPDQKIYFHTAWLKPGRNSYCIERKKLSVALSEGKNPRTLMSLFSIENTSVIKNEFYAHQILTDFRTEHIPFYSNPRHTRIVETEKYKAKDVFSSVIQADSDSNLSVVNNDMPHIKFHNTQATEEDVNQIKKILSREIALIKEIYIYVQSKSSAYPYIDRFTYNTYFLSKADLPYLKFDRACYDTILSSCDFSSSEMEGIPARVFCRATFTESLIRVAGHLYCNMVDKKDIVVMKDEKAELSKVSLARAFQYFIDNKLKKFYRDQNIQRSSFREEELTDKHIELVYACNESPIQLVFLKFCMTSGNILSGSPSETVSLVNCLDLIKNKLQLEISKKSIQIAFSMSKSIVVNEQNLKEQQQYNRLTYIEFLEFISRISNEWFHDTEMDSIPLYRKIEYFLEILLGTVNAQLVRQQILVEEFSESDEEY